MAPTATATGRTQPRQNLTRAICAMLLERRQGSQDAEAILRRAWPKDEYSPLVLRAATSPADTTTSAWASQLAASAVADLVQNLGPISAGAAVLKRGLQLKFAPGIASLSVPTLLVTASDSPFIGEGAPIVVRNDTLTSVSLTPKKMGVIVPFTREIFQYGIDNMELIVRTHLEQSVAAALDSVLFDANAVSSVRPAGLRNGVSAETATTGGGQAALLTDLGKIISKVAGTAQGQIGIIASPEAAAKIQLYMTQLFPFPVFPSSGLATGVVAALALPSVASVIDAPRIEVSESAVLHMEDTTPLAVATTTTAVAAPLRSLWQTNTIAVRLILEINWALRSTAVNCVDWVTGITW